MIRNHKICFICYHFCRTTETLWYNDLVKTQTTTTTKQRHKKETDIWCLLKSRIGLGDFVIRSFGRRDSGKRPPSLLRARLLNRRKELAFGQTSRGQTWNSRWKDYEGGRFWDTFAFQWIWPLEKVSIHPQNPPWGQRGINHRVAKRFTKLHSVIRWPCNGEPHGSKKRKNILKTVIKEDSLHGDKTCAQGSDLEDSAFGLIFCCCRLEILNTFLNKGALSFWTAPFKLFNQSRQQTEQLLKSLPRQVGFSGLGLAPLLGELCFDRKKKKKICQ